MVMMPGAFFFVSQEIASCETKSLRQGAYCPVDNDFAPTETECRLRSLQRRNIYSLSKP